MEEQPVEVASEATVDVKTKEGGENETKETTTTAETPKSPTGSTKSTGGGSAGWGLWGWVDAAKSKSKEVLDAVKKDLDELSTVVKEEASAASEALGLHHEDSTVNTMKKSISSFLGTVSDVLVPPVEDEEAEAIMITKDGMVSLTGFAKHLAELQANDKTYLQEPADELLSQYKRWLEVIEQDQFTEPRLTKQLTNSQILNEKYLSLVPAKVSHMEFWKRYLFKKALLEDAVANAEIAARKAETEASSSKTVVPEKIIVQTEQPTKVAPDEDELQKWEDDICASNMELSEEEQARLLEEYEKEIKERETTKPEQQPVAEVKPKVTAPATTTTTTTSNTTKKQGNSSSKTAQAKQQNNSKSSTAKGGKQTRSKKAAPKEDTTSDESWEKDFDDLIDADVPTPAH